MSAIYAPSDSIPKKVTRHLSRYLYRDLITPNLGRPIVSFSFDDCPKSVVENAIPLLEAEGWLSTFYMACGLCDTTNHLGLHMSLGDIKAVADSGHEIGDHTFDHINGGAHSTAKFQDNIDRNQSTLSEIGISPSRTFAYPYGGIKPSLKKHMVGQFELARGVHYTNNATFDAGFSPATRLYNGEAIEIAVDRLKCLRETPNRWEVLFTHDVRNDCSDYGCTIEDLKTVINAVKDSGAVVLPVAAALDVVRTTV